MEGVIVASRPAITRPSPRRRVRPCPVWARLLGRSSDLQAPYLLQLPSSWLNQCLISRRSFLLTAAGQFRIHTGFPFQPNLAIGHREVKPTLSRALCKVKHNTLWCLCKSFPQHHRATTRNSEGVERFSSSVFEKMNCRRKTIKAKALFRGDAHGHDREHSLSG